MYGSALGRIEVQRRNEDADENDDETINTKYKNGGHSGCHWATWTFGGDSLSICYTRGACFGNGFTVSNSFTIPDHGVDGTFVFALV
jgi:hypothetical protein